MAVAFNANSINNNVRPLISKSSSSLMTARNIISSIDAPDTFFYRTRLRSVPNDISNIETRVKNTNRWLEDAVVAYKKADNKAKEFDSKPTSELKTGEKPRGVVQTILGAAAVGAGLAINPLLTIGAVTVAAMQKKVDYDATATGAKEVKQQKNIFATIGDGLAVAGDVTLGVLGDIGGGLLDAGKGVLNFVGGLFGVEDTSAKVAAAFESGTKAAFDWICNVAAPKVGKAFIDTCAVVGKTLASGLNFVISVGKGILKFGEALVDTAAMIGTAVASVFTAAFDLGWGLGSWITGNGFQFGPATAGMWKGVMSFVAEDWIGKGFDYLYKETPLKYLDEWSYEPFKSDGLACKIGEGVGYAIGIALLTAATMGVGGAVTGGAAVFSAGGSVAVGFGSATVSLSTSAVVSGIIAGVAGIGKGAQEAWGDMRDKSWQGIERAFKSGDIDQETYDYYVSVRNMSDSEWGEIKSLYEQGQIDSETYGMMESIRNMQGDWRTLENGLKGGAFAVASGAWDGVTMLAGNQLGVHMFTKGGTNLMSHIGNSAIKTGARIGIGGIDTLLRPSLAMIYNGKTWEESWEEIGGFSGLATNMAIQGVASVITEGFDLIKLNGQIKKINANELFNGQDDILSGKIKDQLINDHATGKINLKKISPDELADKIAILGDEILDDMIKNYDKLSLVDKAYVDKILKAEKLVNQQLVADALLNNHDLRDMDKYIKNLDKSNMSDKTSADLKKLLSEGYLIEDANTPSGLAPGPKSLFSGIDLSDQETADALRWVREAYIGEVTDNVTGKAIEGYYGDFINQQTYDGKVQALEDLTRNASGARNDAANSARDFQAVLLGEEKNQKVIEAIAFREYETYVVPKSTNPPSFEEYLKSATDATKTRTFDDLLESKTQKMIKEALKAGIEPPQKHDVLLAMLKSSASESVEVNMFNGIIINPDNAKLIEMDEIIKAIAKSFE